MQDQEVKVAFCPTMRPFIQNINFKENVKFYDAGSAANALYYLMTGEVDAVLIGRAANKQELNAQIKEKRLQQGYTLVFNRKMGVDNSQLSQFPVHTYLAPSVAERILPDNKITYHASLDECLKNGLAEPVLIDWNDYRDEFELLIPMDSNGKISVFRAPVLYYACQIKDILKD